MLPRLFNKLSILLISSILVSMIGAIFITSKAYASLPNTISVCIRNNGTLYFPQTIKGKIKCELKDRMITIGTGGQGPAGPQGPKGDPGPQGPQGEPGPAGEQGLPGKDGTNGFSCWDLNSDGLANPEEDINLDDAIDTLDCKGPKGDQGPQGPEGEPGIPGVNGENGTNGLSCWDLNGDGVGQKEEDINLDSYFNTLDCKGTKGDQGLQGPMGLPGPTGPTGPQGTPGKDGANGTNGLSCWDLNGDGIAQLNEDVNADGKFTSLDCKGPKGDQGLQGPMGLPGPTGPTGPQGAPGKDGAKGDTGEQGIQGPQGEPGTPGINGTNGLACWDINGDGIGQKEEDINQDSSFNTLDCKGPKGDQGEKGDKGDPGEQGPKGDPGADGTDGQDGANGQDGQDGVSGWEKVTATSSSNSSNKSQSVQCTGSNKILGGGGFVTGVTNGDVAIYATGPSSNSEWTVSAAENSNTSSNWAITVYAICATVK